jgi:hypothetical protein
MAKVRMPAVRPLGGSPRIHTPTRRGHGKTKWSSASPLPRWKRQPSADLSGEFAPAAHAAQTAGGEHERGRALGRPGNLRQQRSPRMPPVSCFRGRAAREVQSIDELPSQHAQSRGQPIDFAGVIRKLAGRTGFASPPQTSLELPPMRMTPFSPSDPSARARRSYSV